jgi:hypothetical protein
MQSRYKGEAANYLVYTTRHRFSANAEAIQAAEHLNESSCTHGGFDVLRFGRRGNRSDPVGYNRLVDGLGAAEISWVCVTRKPSAYRTRSLRPRAKNVPGLGRDVDFDWSA